MGNRTELALRRALHAQGLRYRVYRADLPGRPDIVFPKERVAIFVDGDYWHGRVLVDEGAHALARKVSQLSEPSRIYWVEKLTKRVARDREITRALTADGWLVFRFWESDLRSRLAGAVHQIERAVRRRRGNGIPTFSGRAR
jgi:DNA mismatch endonuclease (patch repair protein)